MNAPIPVSDALKMLSLALEDCDKATPVHPHAPASTSPDQAFNDLARATMRPLLERLWRDAEAHSVRIFAEHPAYPPLAALRVHYDVVRPGWRKPVMEKCVECGTESIAIDMGRCPPCQSNEASRR